MSSLFNPLKDVGYTRLPFGTYKIQLPGVIHHIYKFATQSEFDELLPKYIRQGFRVCCLDDFSNSNPKSLNTSLQLEFDF